MTRREFTDRERSIAAQYLVLGMAVMLLLILIFGFALHAFADATAGRKIEVRRCHPITATDEGDDALTCECTESDWIQDGDRRILVCEN